MRYQRPSICCQCCVKSLEMLKDVNDPARSDEMYFEGISERPLTVGDYRTAIGGKSGTYSLTVYVRK